MVCQSGTEVENLDHFMFHCTALGRERATLWEVIDDRAAFDEHVQEAFSIVQGWSHERRKAFMLGWMPAMDRKKARWRHLASVQDDVFQGLMEMWSTRSDILIAQ